MCKVLCVVYTVVELIDTVCIFRKTLMRLKTLSANTPHDLTKMSMSSEGFGCTHYLFSCCKPEIYFKCDCSVSGQPHTTCRDDVLSKSIFK